MNDNKQKLIELSVQARELREKLIEEATDVNTAFIMSSRTINSIIIEFFYTDAQNNEFNTYKEWQEKGFQVQKGAKSFVVWGRKRGNNEDKQTDEDDEYRFFPLAYLFSNAQIKPIE